MLLQYPRHHKIFCPVGHNVWCIKRYVCNHVCYFCSTYKTYHNAAPMTYDIIFFFTAERRTVGRGRHGFKSWVRNPLCFVGFISLYRQVQGRYLELSRNGRNRFLGRAIAQAVSRWLPTAAVRGSTPGRHVGFCGGQSGVGAGFLRVLRFLLPNSFHQLLKKIITINQSIIGDMYTRPNGQTSMAAVQGPNRLLGTWNKDT
jgi:hypothetical protein